MTKETALKTKVEIQLAVPVDVAGADGKVAQRLSVTMRRPKLRHAKRVAALLGEDVLTALMSGSSAAAETEEGRAFVVRIVGKLLSQERLDELTAIVADMCGEDVAVIDDLDPADIVEVAMAFADFFPALRSAALSLRPAT